MQIDPWNSEVSSESPLESISFEDNFVEGTATGSGLPDSAAYVNVLENKLARLKKSGPRAEKDVLDSLRRTREDCLVRLLTEETRSVEDLTAEQDIPTKWLKSHLNPQQPLTVVELVELVKADYLANQTEEQNSVRRSTMSGKEIWGKKTLCIVTGASQGIGRTIAVEFAQKFSSGSTFVLIARSLQGLEDTKSMIETSSKDVTVMVKSLDLSQRSSSQYDELMKECTQQTYKSYMLVHNAGTEGCGDLTANMSSLDEWYSYMTLNLFSMSLLTSSFLSAIPSSEETDKIIINITSLAAVQPFAGLGYYCISKASREMFCRMLAVENPSLRILNYSPGPVETKMIDRVIDKLKPKDTRDMFTSMRDQENLLTPAVTVARLINILQQNKFTSGQRIDYFDEPESA